MTTEKKDRIFIVYAFILGVFLLLCTMKSGMFLDEIYTYGMANSYYAPFIKDTTATKSLHNVVITQDAFDDYIEVTGADEAFRFSSVSYNQLQDNHPPLYYMLIHFLSSVFIGSASKWIGLSINIVFFLLTLVVTFQLGKMVFRSRKTAMLPVVLYGLSYSGLSTGLMIRMYMILTFLTVGFTIVVLTLMQTNGRSRPYLYPLAGLIVFIGLLTQYYFAFFAFFISVAFVIYGLLQRQYRKVLYYAACAFAGVLLFILAWPYVFSQFAGVSSMLQKETVLPYIIRYFAHMVRGEIVAVLVALGALLWGLFRIKSVWASYRADYDERDRFGLILGISVLLTTIVIAIASPYQTPRYLYNVVPVFVIVLLYIAESVLRCSKVRAIDGGKYGAWIAVAAFAAISMMVAVKDKPAFLYRELREPDAIIAQYCDRPCVYLDDNRIPPITQDLMQLRQFREVFVTDDIQGAEALAYLHAQDLSNGLVIYVDVNPTSSAYDAKDILDKAIAQTRFTEYEWLYSFSYSEAYLLK